MNASIDHGEVDGTVSAHVVTFPRWRTGRALPAVRDARRRLAADPRADFVVVGRSSGGHGPRDVRRSLSMRRFVVLVEWVDRAAAAEGRVHLDAEWTKAGAAVWSGQLAPIRAHGSWHGTEPFRPGTGAETNATLVLSLTYAQIRLRRLGHFYFVGFPRAARRMTRPPSPMIAGVGFGDVPIRHACTISIWPSAEALDEIAYGATEPHGEIARRSVDGGWLSESLFARFAVVSESGSWSDR